MESRSCAGSHLPLLGSAKFVSLKKKKRNLSGSLGSWRDTIWTSSGMRPEQGVDWTLRAPVISQNHMPGPAGKSWPLSGRLASQNGKLMPALTPVYSFCVRLPEFKFQHPPRFGAALRSSHLLVSLTSCLFCLASRFNVPVLHVPPAAPLIHSSALSARSLLSWFLPILSRSWLTSCILIIHYRRLTWAAPDDFAAVAFPLVCVFMSVWQLLSLKWGHDEK